MVRFRAPLQRYQTMGNAPGALENDPTTVEAFARSGRADRFLPKAATGIASERLARQGCWKNAGDDPDLLAWLQKMSRRRAAGAGRVGGLAPDGQRRLPMNRRSGAIGDSAQPFAFAAGGRLRMALGNGDRQGVATWLACLPEASRNKSDEWRYWRLQSADGRRQTRRLLRRGDVAQPGMTERGFYPMVAAQKLNATYPVMVAVAVARARRWSTGRRSPGYAS